MSLNGTWVYEQCEVLAPLGPISSISLGASSPAFLVKLAEAKCDIGDSVADKILRCKVLWARKLRILKRFETFA